MKVSFNLHGHLYLVDKDKMLRVQCALLAERIKTRLAAVENGKSVAECLRDTLQEINAELTALQTPVFDLGDEVTLNRITAAAGATLNYAVLTIETSGACRKQPKLTALQLA